LIKKLKNNSFLLNTLITTAGIIFASVLNYLFQYFMAKYYSKEAYGGLQTLFSFIYLFSVPLNVIQNCVAFFVTRYIQEKKSNLIPMLFSRVTTIFIKIAGIFIILFTLSIPLLDKFLNLNSPVALFLLGVYLCTYLLIPINRGILQGYFRFIPFAFSFIIEAVLRLSFGLLLINLGLEGAMIATIISGAGIYALTYFPTRKLVRSELSKEKVTLSLKPFAKFITPVVLAYAFFTGMYTFDMIIVKHFFTGEEAGNYAILALLGKIVFWTISPVVNVLFPSSAKEKQNFKKSIHFLWLAMGITASFGLPSVALFFGVPQLLMHYLFPSYTFGAHLLGWAGSVMWLAGFSYVLINYHLSIENTKIYRLPLAFFTLEVLALSFVHYSLEQVVYTLIALQAGLLLSLLWFTYSYMKKQKHGELQSHDLITRTV